ncbi:MAG: macro domain-containing protein [Ectothiorhodospiraceae bacterium]|nr:macro domain-containing protein [Ectothiorhodospiraceae bacterium]
MIHEVTGDILLSRAAAIAHGVAPDDHFSSGLALALRERWPAMAKDFRHWCHVSHPKPGTAWTWAGAEGTRIVNLLTQNPAASHGQHPGKATTENVNHALRELRRIVEAEGFTSIALPRIATGVGGLDWSTVSPLLTRHLGDLPIPVVVYTTFHAGQAADEPI